MTVIIKANPIQIEPFHGPQKLRVGRGCTKKLILGLEKWKRVKKPAYLCHSHCALYLYNENMPNLHQGKRVIFVK